MPRARPALLVTAPPWSLGKVEEEVGDALYPFDPLIGIEVCHGVLLVYSRLNPSEAFHVLMKTPPAYASRVVPVEYVCPTLDVSCISEAGLALALSKHVPEVSVEAHRHGVKGLDLKSLESAVADFLARLGVKAVTRTKPSWNLLIEVLPELTVVALMRYKLDRVKQWWLSKYKQLLVTSRTQVG